MTSDQGVSSPDLALPSPCKKVIVVPIDSPVTARPTLRRFGILVGSLCLAFVNIGVSAVAAETSYPFEGSWIRTGRICNAATTRRRIYSAKDVTSTRGRCSIRRIASGAGSFELLEECRRNDRPLTVTETIRMTSPDSMILKRQLIRLKIPRAIRYARCNAVAPPAVSTPGHPSRSPASDPAHRVP